VQTAEILQSPVGLIGALRAPDIHCIAQSRPPPEKNLRASAPLRESSLFKVVPQSGQRKVGVKG
jgi:hypothetical protein